MILTTAFNDLSRGYCVTPSWLGSLGLGIDADPQHDMVICLDSYAERDGATG
jgi:hypothetical protein